MCKQSTTRALLKTLAINVYYLAPRSRCSFWCSQLGALIMNPAGATDSTCTRELARSYIQYTCVHAYVLYMACHCTSFASLSTLIDRSGLAFMSAASGTAPFRQRCWLGAMSASDILTRAARRMCRQSGLVYARPRRDPYVSTRVSCRRREIDDDDFDETETDLFIAMRAEDVVGPNHKYVIILPSARRCSTVTKPRAPRTSTFMPRNNQKQEA
jgi:hypothetical protein